MSVAQPGTIGWNGSSHRRRQRARAARVEVISSSVRWVVITSRPIAWVSGGSKSEALARAQHLLTGEEILRVLSLPDLETALTEPRRVIGTAGAALQRAVAAVRRDPAPEGVLP